MRKRKKYGYFLLTMLIVSGLAGTPTNNSLTNKERKFATDHLKNSKADIVNTIKGWNEAQLSFRTTENNLSAETCIFQLTNIETRLWQMLETTMKLPANPEKRAEIKMTDEELIDRIQDRNSDIKSLAVVEPKKTNYKSLEAAFTEFKTKRTEHIKYLKNSTEDLRNHVAKTSLGWLDCYQITLLISSYNNRYTQQINEIKSLPGFPD